MPNVLFNYASFESSRNDCSFDYFDYYDIDKFLNAEASNIIHFQYYI